MDANSSAKIFLSKDSRNSYATVVDPQFSMATTNSTLYTRVSSDVTAISKIQYDSTIMRVAQWFLSMDSMSNKKLQKLCYYAYCWFIVFFNDVEAISENNINEIHVLCPEGFQAWIHGPVCFPLYCRYKVYGWHNIPKAEFKPTVTDELESLFRQVWDAYGSYTADELEAISHREQPWQNARKGIRNCEACANKISAYEILKYYSSLG